MSLIGAEEVVGSQRVFVDKAYGRVARAVVEPPAQLSVTLHAAAVGVAVLSLALSAISVGSPGLDELTYAPLHLRPTPGVADAMLKLRSSIRDLGTEGVTPELLALAKVAVGAREARAQEDIANWAAALAEDVVDAND